MAPGAAALAQAQPAERKRHVVENDGKTWKLTLRDGLRFHDNTPVLARDVVASLRRWGPGDGLGRHLMAATSSMDAVDARTFRIVLSRPFGLVLDALGKPSSLVPAIMPERLALDPFKQVTEAIGSGAFRWVKDEFLPGSRAVFAKFDKYVPRPEPAERTAGGSSGGAAVAAALFFATLPDVSALKTEFPKTTAFMERRQKELVETLPTTCRTTG